MASTQGAQLSQDREESSGGEGGDNTRESSRSSGHVRERRRGMRNKKRGMMREAEH